MSDQNETTGATVAPTPDITSPRRGFGGAARKVGATVACTLCCVGPMLFITLGMGSGLVSWIQPLRPIFTLFTIALLAVGFYIVYRRRPAMACAPASANGRIANRSREKVLLWLATVVALLFLTFPLWSARLQ